MSDTQGTPCWYELSTTDIASASGFYGAVLDWTFVDPGMPGMTYTLAKASDDGMVAGLTELPGAGVGQGPPPNWLVYFGCDSCDDTVTAAGAAGGGTVVEPMDIPGTGRFAVLTDPQGAVFGVLQPLPMEEPPPSMAFDQDAVGHGNWHELMSTDPDAGFAFYSGLFGWTKGETMDMGEMGTYQLFAHAGGDIGAMMGLGDAPMPAWLPYFGAASVSEGVERITANGGSVHHGPHEVPGGVFIAVAQDPQGAWFAIVGPLDSGA